MLRRLLKGRRDSTRIVYKILLTARVGVTKTRIVRYVNLNFELAGQYVKDLLSIGLLEKNKNSIGRTTYQVTDRGSRLFSHLEQVEKELWLGVEGI